MQQLLCSVSSLQGLAHLAGCACPILEACRVLVGRLHPAGRRHSPLLLRLLLLGLWGTSLGPAQSPVQLLQR